MRGVVVGKFYPLHKGHDYLISSALAASDHVDVLVVDNPTYKISSKTRLQWIKAQHPKATVHIIPDIYKDDDSEAWATHTINFLGYKPDVVFSSEQYGRTWAKAMGCDYVDADIKRLAVPISGSKIREDILASWNYLGEAVKADLAIRIVILGAESTGTTTLAQSLAKELRVPWVPEVGRYYTESILTAEYKWLNEDFYRIGRLQQSYENEIAARSNGIIVCDTNAVATEVWQRRYMGKTTNEMKQIASRDKADLYIITGDEIPFVQDGIRDGEHIRHQMHEWFIEHIKKTDAPFIVARGDKSERLSITKQAALKIISEKKTIG